MYTPWYHVILYTGHFVYCHFAYVDLSTGVSPTAISTAVVSPNLTLVRQNSSQIDEGKMAVGKSS